jgi:hypothetical protein
MPQKPSESEEEYFARREMEKRKEMAARLATETAAGEREALKQQHWMRCPKDGQELATVRLQGVAVDTCATCGGMWLDAGELDQVIGNTDTGPLASFRKIFKGG